WWMVFSLLALVLIYGGLVRARRSWNPFASPQPAWGPTFAGDTAGLEHTQVVPTLDTPIEEGKNAVWCATFQMAWKQLQNGLLGEPVNVRDAEAVCARLNGASDPAGDLPADAYYAKAGMENEGAIATIRQDMARLFPEKEPPTFPGIMPGSFLMYAYLATRVPFPIPYFDAREPLAFPDGAGGTAPVHSFGIRDEDGDRYEHLRDQVEVLFVHREDPFGKADAFAVDLCRDSAPNQIVVARIEREETLGTTLDALKQRIAAQAEESEHPLHFGGSDVLLVPDMCWRLEHHFLELEGSPFANPALAAQSMDLALQEIAFRLDRSGAELWSEAHAHWASPPPVDLVADRPFLVYVKRRRAAQPFLVLWIENAELLRPWQD
ncbi:MAG: hypothetical protein JXR94_07350, partial [Candidatus Hydrogenedentes bacterium]|nr:hypothetical protein [Candidatus Hydrogenedentota bacterium]